MTEENKGAAVALPEPNVLPMTWYDGPPPFPQDQEWFIAETTYGDRVVLHSLDEGSEQQGSYKFCTADGTYMKKELVKRWMQFPDCMYLPPRAEGEAALRARLAAAEAEVARLRAQRDEAVAALAEYVAATDNSARPAGDDDFAAMLRFAEADKKARSTLASLKEQAA